jgi:hypothetical protein
MRVIVRPRPSLRVPNLIAKHCERAANAQLPPVGCNGSAVNAQQLLDNRQVSAFNRTHELISSAPSVRQIIACGLPAALQRALNAALAL